jgi:carbonic anhydrase
MVRVFGSNGERSMLSALDALEALREGNRRFLSGASTPQRLVRQPRCDDFLTRQQPLAVVLGCSDSRVPVEIVFDQGIGDLFVVRVAGNIAAPSQIASVEFAAERFGTELVVVLGHSRCGAVEAALEDEHHLTSSRSRNLRSIVDRIRPAVDEIRRTGAARDPASLARAVTRANVRLTTRTLRRIQKPAVLVVGAEFALETGVVDFFDVPAG